VLGVGNILMKDEGLGVRAVEKLHAHKLPKNVSLYDAGTWLQSVLGTLEGFDKIIIVDAVKAGDKPGSIYRFTLEELEAGRKEEISFMLSLHEMDVRKAIALEKLVTKLPEEIIFLGMEPAKIAEGLELSKTVEKNMGKLVSALKKECR
jgi:hydrogenase maturation protease